MNKRGVSLIALSVTIIVIIIIAGIALYAGFTNVDKSQEAAFITELDELERTMNVYHERAIQFGNNPSYKREELEWDGYSDYLTNSGKIEDGTREDSVKYIFGRSIPENLKGKLYIKEGKLFVDKKYTEEYKLAVGKYYYMSGDYIPRGN